MTSQTGSPAASVFVEVLQKRSQFLAAARGRKQGTAGFHLQARDRRDGEATVGIGFTCSKKVGNAVARNRAKRRLREAARRVLPLYGKPGWDNPFFLAHAPGVDLVPVGAA